MSYMNVFCTRDEGEKTVERTANPIPGSEWKFHLAHSMINLLFYEI